MPFSPWSDPCDLRLRQERRRSFASSRIQSTLKGDLGAVRTPSPGDASLVILLPEETSRKVDDWRRTHDVQYRVVPPHITVGQPPFVPEAEWPFVRPAVVDLMRDFRPFNVTLAEFSSFETFDQDNHVLWLKPEDRGKVRRIREALEDRLPSYVEELPQDYVPHLTVGFFDSIKELRSAMRNLSREITPLRFRVQELAYLVVDDEGIARVRDRVALGWPVKRMSGEAESALDPGRIVPAIL